MTVNKFRRGLALLLAVFILLPYLPFYAEVVDTANKVEIQESATSENDVVITNEGEVTEQNNSTSADTETTEANVQNGGQATEESKKEAEVSSEVQIQSSSKVETKNLVGEVYETKKATSSNSGISAKSSATENDRVEFQLKRQGMESLKVLQTKTNAPYEVALAHSDGTYTYVDSANSYEEAKAKVNNSVSIASQEWVIPTIISSSGQVVYATNSMGRIWKHIDGKPYPKNDMNTSLYKTSDLSKTDLVVNHGYVDDVPILENNGVAARIVVSGYDGWVNSNKTAAEYDLVVVPLNQAINPSYYFSEGGELKHYISSNLTGAGGSTIVLGNAPSFMTPGVKYLSYDGEYFYKANDLQSGYNTLITDYKAKVRTNSVNPTSPQYTYYQNLPFRSKTIYTAADLDKYINNNTDPNSKLRGLGSIFKDAEQKYGVNALLTLSVAMNESAKGMSSIALNKNNLFGINAVDSNTGQADVFATPGDSVYEFTKNYISRGYSDPSDWRYRGGILGDKGMGANGRYASDPYWGEKASKYAHDVDKYLSNGVSNLKDTNVYQLAIAKSNTKVVNSGGTLLYNVLSDRSQYAAYVGVPMVITKPGKVNISGMNAYEIYPERNTPVGSGGPANKFSGNYDWVDRGYINGDAIQFVNKPKDIKPKQPQVVVKAGSDRYSTAVELSKYQFASADTVVMVNGIASADGLTATPLGAFYNAPLILTEKDNMPKVVVEELKRLGTKKVILVGGESVISSKVISQLKSMGIANVTRLGGSTRYETSLKVAQYIDANCYDVQNIVVTNGYGEADALSIAPIAGSKKMPMILAEANGISGTVYNWLKSESLQNAYIIGGKTALSDTVLSLIQKITSQDIAGNRLGGLNRYDTNAKIVDKFYGSNLDKVYVAKGIELVDALSAGSVAAIQGAPIVITESDLTSSQKTALSKRDANYIVQAGYGVSPTAINSMKKCLEKYEY